MVALASIARFKGKIRELLRKGRGRNVESFIKNELNDLLRGWADYFKLSQVKMIFEELDGWIRRKLRCLLWRQWNKPKTRFKRLVALGLKPDHTKASASNGRRS